jgi:hypothetical protein
MPGSRSCDSTPQARNALDAAALTELEAALVEWQRMGAGLPHGGLRA